MRHLTVRDIVEQERAVCDQTHERLPGFLELSARALNLLIDTRDPARISGGRLSSGERGSRTHQAQGRRE